MKSGPRFTSQMGRSRNETHATPLGLFGDDASARRPLLKRNGMCYFCSFASPASRKLCNYCGPRDTESWGRHLELPERRYAPREAKSVRSSRMTNIVRFGLDEQEEQGLLMDAMYAHDPDEAAPGIGSGDGHEPHTRVVTISSRPELSTPAITICAADDSNLTMDMHTWASLDLHVRTDLAIELVAPTPRSRKRERHSDGCPCRRCRDAADMSNYFKECVVRGTTGQRSTVRVFPEDSSDPNEPALYFPMERTVSTRRASDSLRSTYVAQGGRVQDAEAGMSERNGHEESTGGEGCGETRAANRNGQ